MLLPVVLNWLQFFLFASQFLMLSMNVWGGTETETSGGTKRSRSSLRAMLWILNFAMIQILCYYYYLKCNVKTLSELNCFWMGVVYNFGRGSICRYSLPLTWYESVSKKCRTLTAGSVKQPSAWECLPGKFASISHSSSRILLVQISLTFGSFEKTKGATDPLTLTFKAITCNRLPWLTTSLHCGSNMSAFIHVYCFCLHKKLKLTVNSLLLWHRRNRGFEDFLRPFFLLADCI